MGRSTGKPGGGGTGEVLSGYRVPLLAFGITKMDGEREVHKCIEIEPSRGRANSRG